MWWDRDSCFPAAQINVDAAELTGADKTVNYESPRYMKGCETTLRLTWTAGQSFPPSTADQTLSHRLNVTFMSRCSYARGGRKSVHFF